MIEMANSNFFILKCLSQYISELGWKSLKKTGIIQASESVYLPDISESYLYCQATRQAGFFLPQKGIRTQYPLLAFSRKQKQN
jgi:hypothetical protein